MSPSTLVSAAAPPETQALTPGQYDLITYAVVVAGFALVAGFLYSASSRGEVATKYRPAVTASMIICGVAALSYLVLFTKVDRGYTLTDGLYRPNADAAFSISARYMDWTVTVPILVAELLAVSTLVGRKLSAVRATSIGAAIAMIVTGYLGTQVFDQGGSTAYLWLWWGISMVFFVYLYVALLPAVRTSMASMGAEAGRTYGLATAVLLVTFLVYPIVYLIPVFFASGAWTTTMQFAFSTADVIAKVGFGMLIHKVAKLRTADDLAAGTSSFDGPVWINFELATPAELLGAGARGAAAEANGHGRVGQTTSGRR
ncbi:bacteriorhodopsin [Nocardioidaceae bacterium]|nr:bacteriorhodopsin [Nocardioidaceae bacterium]